MIELSYINNPVLKGRVKLPVSKSMVNRLLMLRVLSGEKPGDDFFDAGTDVDLLREALLGESETVHFMDAGTPLRFFVAYAAVTGDKRIISGGERLKRRPLRPLIMSLEQLGARFEYLEEDGCLPLRLICHANLTATEVAVETDASSQFISALMLVAPMFRNGLTISKTRQTVSEPYVHMTSECLRASGIRVSETPESIRVEHGTYRYPDMKPEADWSAACFPYAWAAAAGHADILLPGLKLTSLQGDAKAAVLFRDFGVESFETENGVRIRTGGKICSRFSFNFSDAPDMFPVIAAVCAFLGIPASFTGVRNLRLKESDRIASMQENLKQTGAELIEENEDKIRLQTVRPAESKFTFKSFGDHRIAMACSIFVFRRDITIDDEIVVSKSFPGYWNELEKMRRSGQVT